MDDSLDVQEIADNFSALASPLRIRILLALTETRQPNWDHRGMSYSDLRDAVGVEDGGRFNYHINELRDQFVRGDDGHYWLTTAGSRVVNEMFAQTFSGTQEPVSGSVEWTCPQDGQPLEATVEYGIISVSCPDHGVVFDMPLSFGATADRDVDELFRWANRRGIWYMESVSWDVCPHCAGSFGPATFETVDLEAEGEMAPLDWDNESLVLAGSTCSRCGVSFWLPALYYALPRPPTIAFLHDHDIDYRSLEFEYGDTDWSHESIEQDDGVLVRFEIDGDQLEVALDEQLDTRSYKRRKVDSE
jgi:hypothetical protein